MKNLFLYLFLALICSSVKAQMSWNLNLTKPVTFTSIDPMNDPEKSSADMWQLSVKQVMALYNATNVNDQFGIDATLNNEKGYAKVSVYLYDGSENPTYPDSRKGPMIFQCIKDGTEEGEGGKKSTNYEYGQWLAWWPDAKEGEGGFYFNDHWRSTDSRSAMLSAAFYKYNDKFPKSELIPVGQQDVRLPVIIEVEIYKADVTGIKIPGIGWIEPSYFRPPLLDIKIRPVEITLDGCFLGLSIPKPPPYITLNSSIDITFGYYNGVNLGTLTFFSSDLPVSKNQFLYLHAGEYQLLASYSITIRDRFGGSHTFQIANQYCTSFVVVDRNNNTVFPFSYHITRKTFQGIPIYGLRGGMSAEYAVEKSVGSLMNGISETWDVRTNPSNGKPDLEGGGPVSVYSDPNVYDFLKRSIQETVNTYQSVFRATTPKGNAIIGTGIAHIPYLASAMKAAFLPMHFLVSVHSVQEVKRILERAKADGYAAFAMLGYDPSIKDIGVAWIKLTKLPPEYLKLLADYKLNNVIITGYNERVEGGEGEGRRILIPGQSDEDFSDQSIYMMSFGDPKTYRRLFMDYDQWNFGRVDNYMDWEGGISDKQVQEISAQLVQNGINTYTIRANDSRTFYEWATDLQKYQMNKLGLNPNEIVMNEYLEAHPEYELYKGHIPYLYWQGNGVNQITNNMYDFTEFKLKDSYPGVFNTIPVYLNAKADRTSLVNALKNKFTNVSMSSWQKADVWDENDGYDSPCEVAAKDIAQNIGYSIYTQKLNSISALTIDEFKTYFIPNSVKPVPSSNPADFPAPDKTELIQQIDEAGLVINKEFYADNSYWQPKNFPNEIEMRAFNPADGQAYPGKILGYLDGQLRPHAIRRQMITTAQFDLGNSSDEYDLQMAYRFNVNSNDGLKSYDPTLGTEQKMDCFEYTSIPLNHWFDIPSRVMARSGAVFIANGGVYDFDYNGLPGVVPFVKKNNLYKGQPQILSFKGEAVFGWKWGTNKSATILSRPKDVPATNIAGFLSGMFKTETGSYPNVMGAMTYMTGPNLYDIKALQPDWMKNYPPFPSYYLTANRCFFAPLSPKCGGTEVTAPIQEGWNDCSMLQTDNAIQRFSTLAYRQFQKTFDDVPNARTFIAMKGNKLDIGLIDGDLGVGDDLKAKIATKTLGMHVYEESQFAIKRGYDQFVNLDGGSSSQIWLNGRGPLQMMNSYILKDDNQGPYYSRLVSSFIMLVPKLHKELINENPVLQVTPDKVPYFDNRDISFRYDDKVDLNKKKGFIDLSPCQDSLKAADGAYGYIAGNFYGRSSGIFIDGGVLFYIGEDMYYPETKGLSEVRPKLRNLLVIGVGKVLPSLIDTVSKLPMSDGSDPSAFRTKIVSDQMSFYYIKVYDGKVVEYLFNIDGKYKYLGNAVSHYFSIEAGDPRGSKTFFVDRDDLTGEAHTYFHFDGSDKGFLNMGTTTHAYLGALNLDGRFLTGNIAIAPYNFIFAVGKRALDKITPYINLIDFSLSFNQMPALGNLYFENGIFALQCLEKKGQHVFGIGKNKTFYGLRLNNIMPYEPQGGKLITMQPSSPPEMSKGEK